MKQNKNQEYSKMVEQASPNSPIFTNCLKAFFSGGFICGIGQLLIIWLEKSFTADETALLVSAILIVASAILTGLGIYEKLGKVCGAGTIVPITGFANSVVSPAIEFKKEGYVLGMAAKMFLLAGPVIVYGTLSSMIIGLMYYFIG
ncbi:stage V sporulation protein AC [Chakrabartyella piscis]|uniref:stage V sporulation protein AC n=1 Tax=Chakrabartyella piscis TaxID=2918914 RepID=UPI0029585F2B|nr:stage V sporulation protein AC [Chakrabartyella piscis]